VSFSIDKGGLTQLAARLRAAGRGVQEGNGAMATRAALLSERDLVQTAFNAGRPVRRGLFMEAPARFGLGARSGALRASVTSDVSKVGDDWIASAGTPLPYAQINEVGGTIRAKSGRALAIPTVNALTPSGDLSNRFSGLGGNLRNARDPGGRKLFPWRGSKAGTTGGWLAGTRGKDAGTVVRDMATGRMKRGGLLILYFLLRKEVHVYGRYAVRAARRRVDAQLTAEYGRTVQSLVLDRI
jgi:phage gpG-like protein